MDKNTLFKQIEEAVVEMEEEEVVELCKKTIEMEIPPKETIEKGLVEGMNRVGELFEEEEYFLPEVLICSDAMNDGIEVLKPHIKKENQESSLKIVIGVVEGDTHDIGKNLVKIMMDSGGFEVYDLGRDVKLEEFVEVAEKNECDVICMSTLMTTTMQGMGKVIDMLEEKGIRNRFKIMVGGGPVSQKFADDIGADIYSKDASEAVRKVRKLKELMKVM